MILDGAGSWCQGRRLTHEKGHTRSKHETKIEVQNPEPQNPPLSFETPSCKTLSLQIGVKYTQLLGKKRQEGKKVRAGVLWLRPSCFVILLYPLVLGHLRETIRELRELSWVTWTSGWGLGRRKRSGATISSPFVLYNEALSKPSVTVHSILSG